MTTLKLKLRLNQAGITLIEMIAVTVVVGIVGAMILTFSLSTRISAFQKEAQTKLTADANRTVQEIVSDIEAASEVLNANDALTNDYVLIDSYSPADPIDQWDSTGTNPAVLILEQNVVDDNNDLIIDTLTFRPYKNNYVYFVDNGSLYRRILANSSASGNRESDTCSEADAPSNPCSPDRLAVKNVKEFSLEFYDPGNVVTTNPGDARSVTVTLVLEKEVAGRTVTVELSSRGTLRNRP